jgi:type VI secretion system secreted protein Hcp
MGSGSGTGKVAVQDFHFTKTVDTSSSDIAKQLCAGKHFPKATFELRKAGGTKPVTYYKVEFDTVYISSMSFGGAGDGGAFTESITFNFKKYKATYTKQMDDGSAGPPSAYGWDTAKNVEA